jgi:YHS domain-containing protein
MKKVALITVCLTVSILVSGALAAQVTYAGEKGKAQTLCPIMGGPIDKTAYVDYEGKRVYFCCPGCKSTFEKDPDKYIQQMESKGIVLEAVPEAKKDPGHRKPGHHGEEHHGCGNCGCGTHS